MQGAHEETRREGPLIVLAGALIMAIAPFTAIAFGDSLFVQTHRDLMWSLDAPIYAIAMVAPIVLVVVAVLALAFPRSATLRGLLGMAAVMAVAVAAGTWVFVLGVDGPQARAAFVNAAITLTVSAIAITVGGLWSLQPQLSLADPDRPITTLGPLLIVAGAVCLAAAPFVFLVFGEDTNRYVIEQRNRLWVDLPQYVVGILPALAAFVFAVGALIRRRSAVVATALLGVGVSTVLLATLSFWWLQGETHREGVIARPDMAAALRPSIVVLVIGAMVVLTGTVVHFFVSRRLRSGATASEPVTSRAVQGSSG
jgi:hypothetical protein